MTRRLLALLAACAALAVACKTPEQKLVDRRRELRTTLDRAYGDYAASAGKSQEGGDPGLFGRVAGEVDRAYFESQCLAVGRGDRPVSLSARLDAFLKDDRNARACRKAADLQLEVDALEKQVSGERR
jgi:hypothetical protein